jgi:hypothetical protein
MAFKMGKFLVKKRTWTIEALAKMLAGYPPLEEFKNQMIDDLDAMGVYDSAMHDLEMGVQSGLLISKPFIKAGKHVTNIFTSKDFLDWAKAEGMTSVYQEAIDAGWRTETQLQPPAYSTPLLQIMYRAMDKFCLAADYPKKEGSAVVSWLMEQEADGTPVSSVIAGAMETIIAPRPYQHHRKRKARGKTR